MVIHRRLVGWWMWAQQLGPAVVLLDMVSECFGYASRCNVGSSNVRHDLQVPGYLCLKSMGCGEIGGESCVVIAGF